MNHQDKFWQTFQDKVQDYSTEEYAPSEWAAMEQLLSVEPHGTTDQTATPTATKPWWMWWASSLLLLFCGGLLLWATVTPPVTDRDTLTQAAPAPATQASAPANPSAAQKPREVAPQAALSALKKSEVPSTSELPPLVTPPAEPTSSRMPTSPDQAETVMTPRQQALPSESLNVTEEALAPVSSSGQLPAEKAVPDAPIANLPAPATPILLPPADVLATLAISPLNLAKPGLLTQVTPAADRIAKRWRPSLIFGGNLLLSNTGRDGQVAGGVVVGLSLQRALSRRWSLEVEAVVRAVTNYDLTLDARDSLINPTGGQALFHREVRTINSYASLDLPLVLHYAAGARWSVATGLRYSYISPLSTSGATLGNSGSSAEVIARTSQPQIWQNDFGFLLGVTYELSPRWSLQLRYTQSGVDLSPDNVYQDNTTHLNSDLQFTARKKF